MKKHIKKIYWILLIVLVILSIIFNRNYHSEPDHITHTETKLPSTTKARTHSVNIDHQKEHKLLKHKKPIDKLTLLKQQCNHKYKTQLNKNQMYFCLAKSGQWQKNDLNILTLQDKKNLTVAYYLSKHNKNWSTQDTTILKLKNQSDATVAHFLAINSKTWTTNNLQILKLITNYGITVEQLLKKRNK